MNSRRPFARSLADSRSTRRRSASEIVVERTNFVAGAFRCVAKPCFFRRNRRRGAPDRTTAREHSRAAGFPFPWRFPYVREVVAEWFGVPIDVPADPERLRMMMFYTQACTPRNIDKPADSVRVIAAVRPDNASPNVVSRVLSTRVDRSLDRARRAAESFPIDGEPRNHRGAAAVTSYSQTGADAERCSSASRPASGPTAASKRGSAR